MSIARFDAAVFRPEVEGSIMRPALHDGATGSRRSGAAHGSDWRSRRPNWPPDSAAAAPAAAPSTAPPHLRAANVAARPRTRRMAGGQIAMAIASLPRVAGAIVLA
jgi:hypothetical protein